MMMMMMMTARARITLRPAVPGWRTFECNGGDKSQRITAADASGPQAVRKYAGKQYSNVTH